MMPAFRTMNAQPYKQNVFRLMVKIMWIGVFLSVHPLDAGIFVSFTGLDTNTGTIDSPYKTVTKAVSVMKANDTIFVRGGTYVLTQVINITKKGNDTTRYYLFAYQNERPLFDFSGMSVSSSNRGISLSGTYWHIKGLDIKGAGDNGMLISASYNKIEFCSFFENRDTGLQLASGASYNQIVNCDSYWNADPGNGNADGFAPKLDVGTGNYFYGCRAWQNSDDGWDGYMRPADSVFTVIENSWCFMNGYLKTGARSAGNGNGFKMGGGDNTNADSLRHYMTLKNSIAFDNAVKGFDQNNNRGSMTLLNCTGFRNGTNFQISSKLKSGSILTVTNSISVLANGSAGTASLLAGSVQTTNSWTPPFTFVPGDFVSLDTAGVRGPRKPDGSLPDLTFLRPSQGSKFIDAGTNVGLPFKGTAPDLGAFESDYVTAAGGNDAGVRTFHLGQNFPNPFNPSTTIGFTLQVSGFTTLKIYDAIGREVATLVDNVVAEGSHTVHFDASRLSGGTYFYTLRIGNFTETKKMSLLK